MLYSQFFTLIAELQLRPRSARGLVQAFCAVTKTMSQGEIFQHGVKRYKFENTIDDYLTIIRGKTAALMSAPAARPAPWSVLAPSGRSRPPASPASSSGLLSS